MFHMKYLSKHRYFSSSTLSLLLSLASLSFLLPFPPHSYLFLLRSSFLALSIVPLSLSLSHSLRHALQLHLVAGIELPPARTLQSVTHTHTHIHAFTHTHIVKHTDRHTRLTLLPGFVSTTITLLQCIRCPSLSLFPSSPLALFCLLPTPPFLLCLPVWLAIWRLFGI